MNGRGGSVGRWVQPRAVVLALVVVGFILSYLFLAPSPRRVPGLLVTDATDILVQRVNKIPFEEQIDDPWQGCANFRCSYDEERCWNSKLTAIVEDGDAPCCAHLLRDMIKIFHEVMGAHGLEYHVAYGTLLGLHRDNKILPWTSDNDLAISEDVFYSMQSNKNDIQKDFEDRGVHYLHDSGGRLCFNKRYRGGALEQLFPDHSDKPFPERSIYSDLVVYSAGSVTTADKLISCQFPRAIIKPLKRAIVCDHTVETYFPAEPARWLEIAYGTGWRVPDKNRSRSGYANSNCVNRKLIELAKI